MIPAGLGSRQAFNPSDGSSTLHNRCQGSNLQDKAGNRLADIYSHVLRSPPECCPVVFSGSRYLLGFSSAACPRRLQPPSFSPARHKRLPNPIALQ